MKNKGSEWRKWDLHLHTPSSYDYSDKSTTNEHIIEVLKDNNISVVAITDHHTIDVERILKLQELAKSDITILPGIEFCADARGEDPIHFIGIFPESDRNRLEYIKTEILSKSNINKQIQDKRNENEIYCDLESTIKVIKELGGIVTIHAGRKSNSIENITNSLPVKMAQKKDIAEIIDIFELGKVNDQEDYREHVFPSIKKIFPMIICSDNHDIKSYTLKQNCWIKADPTFEGLKQIIYEPEERVRIQESNPEYDFDKPTFSKISITQPLEVFNGEKVKFDKTELPLNKNLVTIIGGRGTGKSLLLNYIANTFKKPILAYQNKDKPIQFNESEHFVVEWQKSNAPKPEIITFEAKKKGDLDLIFIEQGKLKNISNYRVLADEIKILLKIEKLQFDEKLDNEIKELLDDIKKLKEWFEYKNEKGEKVNDRKFNENKKQEAENLLKTITTEDNKKKLEIYTSNIKTINNCENILTSLNDIKNSLAKFQADTNNTINNINSDIEKEINDLSIPKIDFENQTNAIKNIEEKMTTIVKDKKGRNNEIKKEFEERGYKGDLETLLSSAEKYQKNIQNAEVKLKEIEEKEKQLKAKIQQRNNLSEKLKVEYERQKNVIRNAWNNLLDNFSDEQRKVISNVLGKRGISIEGEIYFNLKAFNEKLKEYLDLRTYKNLSEGIGINSLDGYWHFINSTLQNFIEGKEKESTKKDLENLFFNLQERKDYLYVVSKIKFLNKTLDQLSVGQKGTLYLLLQLATNTFSSPLIFDQPEDDLDNEFITTELVGLFKELKKYRQIIISTHNANFVVTADAEQVIVAKNKDEILTYSSGSLENSEINESVCRILEGGKDAFEKRRNKYNF